MCPETECSRTQGRENGFYIEKGGEPEVKSSFCHVVLQLAWDAHQNGPVIREKTAHWFGMINRHKGARLVLAVGVVRSTPVLDEKF